MGLLGLFVAQIGQEGIHAYDRFTFGWNELAGGISLIPALVGAFGFAEILTVLTAPAHEAGGQQRRLGAAALPRRVPVLAHRSCARA